MAEPIFFSVVSPRPGTERSCSCSMAARRPSTSSIPRWVRSACRVLGPTPGMRLSSTTAGGNSSRSASSFSTDPVSMSSRILAAVAFPTPLIFVISAFVSVVMSRPSASMPSLALS